MNQLIEKNEPIDTEQTQKSTHEMNEDKDLLIELNWEY